MSDTAQQTEEAAAVQPNAGLVAQATTEIAEEISQGAKEREEYRQRYLRAMEKVRVFNEQLMTEEGMRLSVYMQPMVTVVPSNEMQGEDIAE